MAITNISRVRSIVFPVTANESNVLAIYEPPTDVRINEDFMSIGKVVSFNCFIKNLKAFARISTLPEAELPDIQLDDTSTQKLYKVLDIEWKSPRKQLNLYISTNYIWSQIGSVSLLNPMGYPFRIYNLMDMFTDNLALELGENSRIGIQIQDVGYGLLKDMDSVTIHGSYVEKIFIESKEPPINLTVNVTGSGNATSTVNDSSLSNNNQISNSFLIGN